MSGAMDRDGTLLVGGLGWPYDDLLAAALGAEGFSARALGALDDEALDRGRAVLPRGQCAPVLYLTGALLRAAQRCERQPVTYLGLQSCGPCRFALFGPAWRAALGRAGEGDVRVVDLEQSAAALTDELGAQGLGRVLDAVAAGDALAASWRRIAPHVQDPDALDGEARRVTDAVARAVAEGEPPRSALASARQWWRGARRRSAAPLGRAVLVGEPWSLHVEGDGQLHLPAVLARAGVEVEVPPLSLWVAYRAWEQRQGAWGRSAPSPAAAALAGQAEARLRRALAEGAQALGMGAMTIPDVQELAELAAPHLSPAVRGGYGHVEVGLGVRAARERRAHVVLSVKSFGCIPSSGISDAILPTALGPLPYLAVEVCGDGDAARESRLMMRVAAALEAAEREMDEACAARGVPRELALARAASDPAAGRHEGGERPFACTLACDVLDSPAFGGVPS